MTEDLWGLLHDCDRTFHRELQSVEDAELGHMVHQAVWSSGRGVKYDVAKS